MFTNLTNNTTDYDCTELVTFNFEHKLEGKQIKKTKATLYVSPAMIRETEAWLATQNAEPYDVYQHLVAQGAIRDGRDCWHAEIVTDRSYRDYAGYYRAYFTLEKAVSETWRENQLDIRETTTPNNKPGLREFFKNGALDPDRPAQEFKPLDKTFGDKITVTSRPDEPQRGLLDIPKL